MSNFIDVDVRKKRFWRKKEREERTSTSGRKENRTCYNLGRKERKNKFLLWPFSFRLLMTSSWCVVCRDQRVVSKPTTNAVIMWFKTNKLSSLLILKISNTCVNLACSLNFSVWLNLSSTLQSSTSLNCLVTKWKSFKNFQLLKFFFIHKINWKSDEVYCFHLHIIFPVCLLTLRWP